jgi:hypothetical protein
MRKYALCVHPLYNQTCERMEIHRDEFMMRFCSCWIRLVNYIREITQTCCCIISMLTHAFPVSAGFPSGVSLAFPNFYSYGPQKLQECSSFPTWSTGKDYLGPFPTFSWRFWADFGSLELQVWIHLTYPSSTGLFPIPCVKGGVTLN